MSTTETTSTTVPDAIATPSAEEAEEAEIGTTDVAGRCPAGETAVPLRDPTSPDTAPSS